MKKTIIFLIVISSIIFGCGPQLGDKSYTEIKRITSPDSLVDAVICETNGGATTSYGYLVFIVPKGQQYSKEWMMKWVFNADHIDSLSMKWKENKYLEISYKQARIFEFTNFWQSKEIKNYSYVVEIKLTPLTNDFSLSRHDRWLQ